MFFWRVFISLYKPIHYILDVRFYIRSKKVYRYGLPDIVLYILYWILRFKKLYIRKSKDLDIVQIKVSEIV